MWFTYVLPALFRGGSQIVALKGKVLKLDCGQQIKHCCLKISCTPLRLTCMFYSFTALNNNFLSAEQAQSTRLISVHTLPLKSADTESGCQWCMKWNTIGLGFLDWQQSQLSNGWAWSCKFINSGRASTCPYLLYDSLLNTSTKKPQNSSANPSSQKNTLK